LLEPFGVVVFVVGLSDVSFAVVLFSVGLEVVVSLVVDAFVSELEEFAVFVASEEVAFSFSS